jgi:hypothetical protein
VATWIYQVNPAKFNINGCLVEAPDRVAWMVNAYETEIKPSDQVFIWRSKAGGGHGTPGIVAECAVDSLVTPMPADPVTKRFSHQPSPAADIDRAWLRITAIAEEDGVLSDHEIAEHELLRKVGPLRFKARTIYKVSGDESRALNSLWGPRRKRSRP